MPITIHTDDAKYVLIRATNDSMKEFEIQDKPDRVWTVLDPCQLNKELRAGGAPRHWHTAFLDDWMHDWSWKAGKMSFHAHSSQRGDRVTLLLVYKKN